MNLKEVTREILVIQLGLLCPGQDLQDMPRWQEDHNPKKDLQVMSEALKEIIDIIQIIEFTVLDLLTTENTASNSSRI